MSDQYAMMMGLDLTDEEKMRLLADSLRGKQQAADFFSLSTVPTINTAATERIGQLQDTGERVGRLKNALAERQADAEVARLNRESRESEGALNRQNRLDVAAMRGASDPEAGNRGGYDPRKPYGALKTSKERSNFTELGGELATIGALGDTYKDDYGAGAVPWTGKIENFLGTYLPDAWGFAEQANWFANFEKFYSMPARHNIFGSAFTKVEQEAWSRAHFDPNTQADLAKNRLRMMVSMAKRAAEKSVIDAYESNVSLDLIESNYGDVIDVHELLNMWENNRQAYYQKRVQDLQSAAQFLNGEGVPPEDVGSMYDNAIRQLSGGGAAENAPPAPSAEEDEHAALRSKYGLDR